MSGSGTITFSDYPNFADYPCSDDGNYTFSAGMCGNSYGEGYDDWAGYYILSQ